MATVRRLNWKVAAALVAIAIITILIYLLTGKGPSQPTQITVQGYGIEPILTTVPADTRVLQLAQLTGYYGVFTLGSSDGLTPVKLVGVIAISNYQGPVPSSV